MAEIEKVKPKKTKKKKAETKKTKKKPAIKKDKPTFELTKDDYGKGYEFFNDLVSSKGDMQNEMMDTLLLDSTVITFLEQYLVSTQQRKTVLDFCVKHYIPSVEYENIIRNSNNKYLLYLHGILATMHKHKLYTKIEDSNNMASISGSIHVLKRLFNEGEHSAGAAKTTVNLNFSGVSPDHIDAINNQMSDIAEIAQKVEENDDDNDE